MNCYPSINLFTVYQIISGIIPPTTQYLFSIYNVIISLNIILFIVYCVYVINAQRGTIEEVNQLYHELQTANEQLKEYADMSRADGSDKRAEPPGQRDS